MTAATHVFVCYSMLSFEAAVRIIEDLRRRTEPPPCAMLLLFEADLARVPGGVRTWELTPPMHALSRLEKPFRIAAWFEGVYAELRREYPGPVHAYVPHPVELPGNHFVFSRGPNDKVDLLPDGLINYFERTMRPERLGAVPRYCFRIVLEWLAAWRHGFRYRAVWGGHQTQYEEGQYGTSWAFNPKGYLTVSGKLEVLPRPQALADGAVGTESSADREVKRRAVLFLDQELHQVVGPTLERRLRDLALARLREEGAELLFYKAHPRGQNRAWELEDLGLPVIDRSGPLSAEQLVAGERIAAVVGFYSTTLMLLSDADVPRRVAVFPDPEDPDVRRPALVRDARVPIEASGAIVLVAGGKSGQ